MTKIEQTLVIVIDYILLLIGGEHVGADRVSRVAKNELSGHHLRDVRLCLTELPNDCIIEGAGCSKEDVKNPSVHFSYYLGIDGIKSLSTNEGD